MGTADPSLKHTAAQTDIADMRRVHPATVVLFLTVTLVLVSAADVMIGSDRGFQWLNHVTLLVASLAIVGRGVARRSERTAWLLIGLGCLAWTAGDSYWFAVLAHVKDPPYPSLADAGWLSFYPTVFTGLVLLIRARIRDFRWTLWIDGIAGGLAIAALCAAVVVGAVLSTVGGGATLVAVNLAYPAGDALLLAVAAVALSLTGWKPGQAWVPIMFGLAVFAVCDSIYLVQIASGTFVGGTPLDLGWQVGIALLAIAAWRPSQRSGRVALESWYLLLPPVVFGLLALGLELYDHFAKLNLAAILLASSALLTVIVRFALTFGDNLRMMAESRREACTDALTGLGNRRKLLVDLEELLSEGGSPAALALFDLDGFKAYNDAFGHPAGDELLARLGKQLAAVVDDAGHAYRMGGDEFCILVDLGGQAPGLLVGRAADALSASGTGFDIGASAGCVLLPAEADRTVDALRTADTRMYATKLHGRSSAARQTSDVLQRVLEARYPDLSEHGHRVAELAEATALRSGLSADAAAQVRQAAELHDVGKIAIPDAILVKRGPLDEDEWRFIRRHTIIGERIVRAAPSLEPIARLVRSSHERYDGSGYPDRLAGHAIPAGSRIIAVCDAFHAMTSGRPYAPKRDVGHAMAELRRCAGSQFDPGVVRTFCAIVEEERTRSRLEQLKTA